MSVKVGLCGHANARSSLGVGFTCWLGQASMGNMLWGPVWAWLVRAGKHEEYAVGHSVGVVFADVLMWPCKCMEPVVDFTRWLQSGRANFWKMLRAWSMEVAPVRCANV
eukprot:1161741-Pelagomonas_calceolata.AAC.8